MVQADGHTVYEQLMAPGETQTFDARRRIFIRAGNPTSVLEVKATASGAFEMVKQWSGGGT